MTLRLAECAKGGVCEGNIYDAQVTCLKCGRDLSMMLPYIPAPRASSSVSENKDNHGGTA